MILLLKMLALARLTSCAALPAALARSGALVAPRAFIHVMTPVCAASASAGATSAATAARPLSPPAPAAVGSSAASSAAAAPLARPTLRKWRLRKSGRWIDCAPYITSITLSFDPGVAGTMGCKCVIGSANAWCLPKLVLHCAWSCYGSEAAAASRTGPQWLLFTFTFCFVALLPPVCRELWRQARSRKVRKEFSKYTVGMEVNEHGFPAAVKVVYIDGSKLEIAAQGKDAGELMMDVLVGTEGMKDKEDVLEMEKN